MSQSAFLPVNPSCSFILIGNRVRVKSSGLARGLANARPPGSATFANAPLPGLTRRENAPGGGGRAQGELSDALGSVFFFLSGRSSVLCCKTLQKILAQICRAL